METTTDQRAEPLFPFWGINIYTICIEIRRRRVPSLPSFFLLPYGYLIDCVTGVASTQATTTTTVQGRTGGESNEELRPFIIDFRRTKNIASVSFPFFLVLANFFEEKKKSVNERGKEKDRVPSWYGQQTLDLECRPMEVHRQVFSISLFFVCAFVRTPSQSLYIYLLNSARKD